MAKIIEKRKEFCPRMKFVGKKYLPSNIGYGKEWGEWFQNNWFSQVENLQTNVNIDNGYIGLMKWKDNDFSNYEYWIGVFVNLDEVVPSGYESTIIPESNAITYFIKGVDGPELYGMESEAFKDMINNEKLLVDEEGYSYCFERYNCPRFTTPDNNNEVILDYLFLIR